MNENLGNTEEAVSDADQQEIIPWLQATLNDLNGLDFEAPISGIASADTQEISRIFQAASQSTTCVTGDSASRIFAFVAAVTGMYFKPQDRNEPFGPMCQWADGRRTAISSDFRSHVDLLAQVAEQATNSVLRARFADLCWLLDPKRANLAVAAIAAYGDIVMMVDRKELVFRLPTDDGALNEETRDQLRRALQIARVAGSDKPETAAVRQLTKSLREKAIEKRNLLPILLFTELDLEFRISDALQIGASLEKVLADLPSNTILD
ncbi:MAG: hypothetical protein ACLP8A_11500, partial [Methylovirgula sp.]